MQGNAKNSRAILTAKIALVVGVVLLLAWTVLGTGASLAWYTDETPPIVNVIDFAEFDLDVYYKNHNMDDYEEIKIDTNIFGDDALYEPNYTQLVHLKVKNNGTTDMKYRIAIDVRGVTLAESVLGNEIYLPNYLRFGVAFSNSEAALDRTLAQDNAVEEMATLRFNHFSEWDSVVVAPGEERYIALVVHMPKTVGNAANYRGDTAPDVNLGITVYAEQLKS